METLNIYKIWVDGYIGYDAYDSAIVVAKDEEKARYIHPGDKPGHPMMGYNPETRQFDTPWYEGELCFLDWQRPENVKVTLVGTTDLYDEGAVLCASFNAG